MINLRTLQTVFAKFSKREKIIFYVTAAVLLIVFLDKAIFFPSFSQMKLKDQEIENKKKIVMKDIHMLALKEDVEKEMGKYESYFSPPRTSEEEVTSTLKEIENLASKAKVSVISIRPGEVREEDFFESYLVNLTCEGTMTRLISFLHAIETAPTLLTVERYIISPAAAGSRQAQCRITISKTVIPE